MQYWVKATGFRMTILFEGRDGRERGIDQTAGGTPEPPWVSGGSPELHQSIKKASGISSAMWSIFPVLEKSLFSIEVGTTALGWKR